MDRREKNNFGGLMEKSEQSKKILAVGWRLETAKVKILVAGWRRAK